MNCSPLIYAAQQTDRHDRLPALNEGPMRVHMGGGKSNEIADHQSGLVDSTTAYVLYRREDGKRHTR